MSHESKEVFYYGVEIVEFKVYKEWENDINYKQFVSKCSRVRKLILQHAI